MLRAGAVWVLAGVLGVMASARQAKPAFEVASARVVLDMNLPTTADFRLANVVTEQRVHLVQPLRSILQRALRVQKYYEL
jgi:hypothetical protein